MTASLSAFTRWALDDARTGDERYLIFLVCEACRMLEWQRLPVEEQRQRVRFHTVPHEYWKELYLNPLLMPEYDEEDTERAAALAVHLKKFAPETNYERRKIGEAGAVLRFFPALEELKLGYAAMQDVSFVEALPALRILRICSGALEDLGPLARCHSLRDLSLTLSGHGPPFLTPPVYWTDARPLGALRQLERLALSPNPAILEGLSFPELTCAELSGEHCIQPDCSVLPDMPKLRVLKLTGVQSLRGISRFPELRHLKIAGPLRDFGDISALRKIDCVEVDSAHGWPRDVAPLAALPELIWARFGGEMPRNYWPMAQAPKLCGLEAANAPVVQLEVEAVNATLRSWDEIFSLPEPRPRPPLRFVAVAIGGDTSVLPKYLPEPEPDYLEHPKRFHLELLWMHRRVLDAVNRAAGIEDAIEVRSIYYPSEIHWERTVRLSLQRLEAARRLPAVIEALRETMGFSPNPWVFQITIGLRITELEMTEQQKMWLRQIEKRYDRWDDERDVEKYIKTQQHLIETQFKLRQSQEDGEEPDPEDFVPPEEIRPESHRRPALTPASPAQDDEEKPDFTLKPFDEQEQNSGDDDDDDGNVKTAPPPDPPQSFWDDPYEHPLADSYRFYATLTFDTLYHHGHNLATLVQLLGREPDEYHPAPEK